jgi:hypothetical protein
MHAVTSSKDCELDRNAAYREQADGVPLTLVGAALLLLWPALLNGYPLVFSDTGTYLSQMVEHHLGWDRPIFYSAFLLVLHLKLTTWPAIIVQALLVVYTLRLALRCFAGMDSGRRSDWWLVAVVALLAAGTSLPWITAQLMPDLATPLLVIVLAVLVITPDRVGWREHLWLGMLAAGLITVHQSNVLLAPLLFLLLPLRAWLGAKGRFGWRCVTLAVGPLLAAMLALTSVNLIGHGRASLSPYGNIFLLTRSLYDGPAMDALRRHCPDVGWRLCVLTREGLPLDSDEFLWNPESPLYHAGGPKIVSAEANAILTTAVREEPWITLRAAIRNTVRQLTMFATGDGLIPWPGTVTPVIRRIFPHFEVAMYDGSLQTRGRLAVPSWLQDLHRAAFAAGLLATLGGLMIALRRRHRIAGLAVAVMVGLFGNAAITGALSGPHDRYQSRVVWLVVFVPPAMALAWRYNTARRSISQSPDPASAREPEPTALSV